MKHIKTFNQLHESSEHKEYTVDDVEFKKLNLETKDGKYIAGSAPGYKAYWWGVTHKDDEPLKNQRQFTYKKKSTYSFKWKMNDSPEEIKRCKRDGVDKLNKLLGNSNTTFIY